jgi:HD superfamily phosphohydrolase
MSPGRALIFYDAVHGIIELNDPDLLKGAAVLRTLLATPQLQRLRRLRLLPFGSHAFLAADHTRYAHAIGSAYTALRILQRLYRMDFFNDTTIADLRQSLPRLSSHSEDRSSFLTSLSEHIVVCALLQDLGELPYKPATDLFFYPHSSVAARVAEHLDVSIEGVSNKDIFTLNSIIDIFNSNELVRQSLNIHLIAYLVTGSAPEGIVETNALKAYRQIVDGVVDADRLDYVYRDAYHTLGGGISRSAEHIINSLTTYDHNGPIFDSAGPVSNFLMQRAMLRSQVYYAPDVRFRVTLLASTLSGLLKHNPSFMSKYFDAQYGALSAEAFFRLDDVSLLAQLESLRASRDAEMLDASSRTAIDMIATHNVNYDYAWLDRPVSSESAPAVTLKSDIFVDTDWDHERHQLYRPGSVRIMAKPSLRQGETIALENSGGHGSEFLQMLWESTPVQAKVLFFVPVNRIEWFADAQRGDEKTQLGLYQAAVARESDVRLSVVDDTRNYPGYSGPAVFISFCWDDIDVMRAMLRLLYDRKRRYYAFVEEFHGLGGNTRKNGSTYASQAEAAIILLSRSYVDRVRDPNGNIYPELMSLGRRLPSERIVVVSLDSVEEYGDTFDSFPWALIGYESGAPYLGAPLRSPTADLVSRAVDAALRVIDGALGDQ